MRFRKLRIAWSFVAGMVFGFLLFCNEAMTVVPEAEQAREYTGIVLGVLTLLSFSFWCASPWLRYRFSLRTLLIATTLVAVVLGLVAWAARN